MTGLMYGYVFPPAEIYCNLVVYVCAVTYTRIMYHMISPPGWQPQPQPSHARFDQISSAT
jgi:hypothetical protein